MKQETLADVLKQDQKIAVLERVTTSIANRESLNHRHLASVAVSYDDVDVLKKVANTHAELNLVEDGMSVLDKSIAMAQVNAFRFLSGKVKRSEEDEKKLPFVVKAVISNDAEICQIALNDPSVNVNAEDIDGLTALCAAISFGFMRSFKVIVACERVNLNYESSKSKLTAAMCAAQHENIEALNLLVAYGVDLTKPNSEGRSALMLATEGKKENSIAIIKEYEKFKTLSVLAQKTSMDCKDSNDIEGAAKLRLKLAEINSNKVLTISQRLKMLQDAYTIYEARFVNKLALKR